MYNYLGNFLSIIDSFLLIEKFMIFNNTHDGTLFGASLFTISGNNIHVKNLNFINNSYLPGINNDNDFKIIC